MEKQERGERPVRPDRLHPVGKELFKASRAWSNLFAAEDGKEKDLNKQLLLIALNRAMAELERF